jgi:hypothetical protein
MRKSKVTSPDYLIRSGRASHIAQMSVQHLHRLADSGKLSFIMIDGFRFFHREEIERLAADREGSAAHAG